MRARRVIAASTLVAGALGGSALRGSGVSAGDGDGDGDNDTRDKNVLLAEAQFQLFLVNANFQPTDITCTDPPVRDVAGELLCYGLISQRASVAAIATMESPGEYTYLPLNKVDPADLEAGAPTADVPSEEADPEGSADQAIIDSIDAAVVDAEGLGRVLMENNASIASVDLLAYHAPTSTVQVTVSADDAAPDERDGIAFYVTDVMAFLWAQNEPTRAAGATVHPRLEVTVDGVIYGTPFEVMTRVADYTITEGEWLAIVTGNAPLAEATKTSIKNATKASGKSSDSTSPVGVGAT